MYDKANHTTVKLLNHTAVEEKASEDCGDNFAPVKGGVGFPVFELLARLVGVHGERVVEMDKRVSAGWSRGSGRGGSSGAELRRH